MADLNSILQGTVKSVFQPAKNVTIEPDTNPALSRLRFGSNEDDYFLASGGERDLAALRSILSKVVESPTQLRKIKELPKEKRPTLIALNGMGGTAGYCDGKVICLNTSRGTGYRAAATFVHEFQHQYQEKHDGIDHYKGELSLSEDILDDRLFESAAETASYQYLYEMKDANLDARIAYEKQCRNGWYAQGMCAYVAAKEAGKPEPECILAGMTGYAKEHRLANCYETDYHQEIYRTDASFGVDDFADYLQEGRKEAACKRIDRTLGGKKLDEIAAFKSHTVGMTDQAFDEKAVRDTVRSPEFAFVTQETMGFLSFAKEVYEKYAGKKHAKADEVLSVRDDYGIRKSTDPERQDKLSFRQRLRNIRYKVEDFLSGKRKPRGFLKEKEPVVPLSYPDGTRLFSLDGRDKDPEKFTAAILYREDIKYEKQTENTVPYSESDKRFDKIMDTFAILMKDEKLREQLTESSSENPVVVGFGEKPNDTGKRMIALDPSKKPEQLAEDFRHQFAFNRQYHRLYQNLRHPKAEEVETTAAPAKQSAESKREAILKTKETAAKKAPVKSSKAQGVAMAKTLADKKRGRG